MNNLKYVVTDENDFAIFTTLTEHRKIGDSLFGKPVGAGFVTRDEQGNFKCYGESISLNLKSRKEDEVIINKTITN